jgi:hypothetical protein
MTDSVFTIPQDILNANEKDDGTWVKEHRSIMEHVIFDCPYLYKMWRFLIMKAQWEDGHVWSNGEVKIPLKKGEVVASISYLMKALKYPKSRTYTKLQRLKSLNAIETRTEQLLNENKTKSKQGITVIRICNYSKYQGAKNEQQTISKRLLNANETKSELKVGTIKELKKERTKEEIKDIPSLTPSQGSLLKKWIEFSKEASKTKLAPDEQKYGKAILDLERLCGVSTEKLEEVLAFVRADDFWRPNAISLPGLLLKGKNGLRKIENILHAMDKGGIGVNQFGRTPEQQRIYEEWLKSDD